MVGGSGTGKSHKVFVLACEMNIDLVIDDGLLIADSKIIAGKSAKREDTKIGAIKRALFMVPGAAEEARQAIASRSPRHVLILGTSRGMVEAIARTLKLPPPTDFIDIREISAPEEIRRAARVRREQGKHVIPVPTVEVKKTFSGYLVDPIKFFVKLRGDSSKGIIVEKSVVRPTWSMLGRFTVADTVLLSLAAHSARQIKGVSGVGRISVDTHADGVTVDMDVSLVYGVPLYEVLEEVQKRVTEEIEYATALNVQAVNVTARRLIFDDEGNPMSR